MPGVLDGKVALVTGGSRGLGAATARALATSGADVAITYVASGDAADVVVGQLEGAGVRAAAIRADQADTATAPGVIADVVDRFGALDILVNNAAISVQAFATIDSPDSDEAYLDRMHATNYLGVIALIRSASRVIRDGGRIISIGSGLASRAGHPGFADYAATKAGIVGYSKGVARDLGARGISVNVVQAGLMRTDMNAYATSAQLALMTFALAFPRLSEPAETAAVIAFLASPAASYITGAVLDCDGGYTA